MYLKIEDHIDFNYAMDCFEKTIQDENVKKSILSHLAQLYDKLSDYYGIDTWRIYIFTGEESKGATKVDFYDWHLWTKYHISSTELCKESEGLSWIEEFYDPRTFEIESRYFEGGYYVIHTDYWAKLFPEDVETL